MTGERGKATRARRNLISVASARRNLAVDMLGSLVITGVFVSRVLDPSREVQGVQVVALVLSWALTASAGASLLRALRRQAATATGAES